MPQSRGMETDDALRAYYERAGFTSHGEVALGHRVAARYEKRIPDDLASE